MRNPGGILRIFPRGLARLAYRVAHLARVIWWQRMRPTIHGCRIIALDQDDRVLLVRHTYGNRRWVPPGGGLGRGEDATIAACRELLEETGCELLGALPIVEVVERLHGATNHVIIVAGRVLDKPEVDGREVAKAAFFRASRLPSDINGSLRMGLSVWIKAAATACPVPDRETVFLPSDPVPKA